VKALAICSDDQKKLRELSESESHHFEIHDYKSGKNVFFLVFRSTKRFCAIACCEITNNYLLIQSLETSNK
jgi:hypothetical protein